MCVCLYPLLHLWVLSNEQKNTIELFVCFCVWSFDIVYLGENKNQVISAWTEMIPDTGMINIYLGKLKNMMKIAHGPLRMMMMMMIDCMINN